MTYRYGKLAFLVLLATLAAGAVYLGACQGSDGKASTKEKGAADGSAASPAAENTSPTAASGAARPPVARILSAHGRPASEPMRLEPGETEVLIVYTGVTHGSIEACGCPGNPTGGLTKEFTVVEQLRRRGTPMLYVHPGDLFPYDKTPVKTPLVAEAAAQMGYDAMAIGEQELIEGLATFRKLAAEQKLPFFSENLRDLEGKRLAPGYTIKALGGIKIGVFAILGSEHYLYLNDEFAKEVTIQPAVEAVDSVLKELAGRVDFIVLLSQQDKYLDRELARRFPQINVIIGGHDEELIVTPIRVEQAILCNAGILSEQVGVVHLAVDPARHVRILGHEFLPTSAPVPKNPRIDAIYERYAKAAKITPEDNEAPLPEVFEPVSSCEPCHAAMVQEFRRSKHAAAWEAIVKAGRADDRECWFCHTAGSGRADGFRGIKETPELSGVTCQSCHLLTHDHAARGIKGSKDYARDEKTCRQCHTNTTSADFNVWDQSTKVDHHEVKEKSNHPPAGYVSPKLAPARKLTPYLTGPQKK